MRSEALSAAYDADVYHKREETLPTGAFKVRGGITLVSGLDEEFREQGLIAVPEDANPERVAAMERLGARVDRHGADIDEAREWAEERAATEGYRYVHSANEPKLVVGVGTAGLEVVEDLPEVEYVFCPTGGGSGASGYREIYDYLDDRYETAVSREGFVDRFDEIARELYAERVDLLSGFSDLLAELRDREVALAAVSSSPHDWIDVVLERFDLEGAFDAVVSAESIDDPGNPDPAIFAYAADELGVSAEECVAVEDSEHGDRVGRARGRR